MTVYVTELRKIAKSCELGDLHDSLIGDRIICGIKSDKVRARLLREPDLALTKVIETCRATELSKSQLQNIVKTYDKHVSATTKPRKATSR